MTAATKSQERALGTLYVALYREGDLLHSFELLPGKLATLSSEDQSDFHLDTTQDVGVVVYQEGRDWVAMATAGSFVLENALATSSKLMPGLKFSIEMYEVVILSHSDFMALSHSAPSVSQRSKWAYLKYAALLLLVGYIVSSLIGNDDGAKHAASEGSAAVSVSEEDEAVAGVGEAVRAGASTSSNGASGSGYQQLRIKHNRAVQLFNQGDIAEAIDLMSQLIELEPENTYYVESYKAWSEKRAQVIQEYFVTACKDARYLRYYEARNYFAQVVTLLQNENDDMHKMAKENIRRYDAGEAMQSCEGLM